MDTLVEILPRIEALGGREAVRFSNGIRTWVWSYTHLFERICAFSEVLKAKGIGRNDRVIVWSENRPEWLAVFWASVARGVVVVPIDFHSSWDRLRRIQAESKAKLLVHGARAQVDESLLDCFPIDQIEDLPPASSLDAVPVDTNDVVEILYTSGTTAVPKGVVHRHRNICSNLTPIAKEIARYQRLARPFQPIRFLNMVPLSHMFGQSIGLFVPPILGGAVAFMTELHPGAILRTIQTERISVLVCVPRILATLRAETQRRHPSTRDLPGQNPGIARRWWRYRSVHRDFGLKFWSFVVGGARLDESLEAFWSAIGLLVVQGYGLTETSPVVSVNHPFHAKRGTLGTGIGGQEIRVAEDGEILVRGPSVVEEYIGGSDGITSTTDDDGWFHTGDIGAMDADGRLVYRGRKKDLIVTPDGLNIHPEDVEGILNQVPGVRDSVVVAVEGPNGERPHAALILDPQTDPARVIEQANRNLEPEQRLQVWSVWPDDEFPRTDSTYKLQRHRVAAAIRLQTGAVDPTSHSDAPRTFIDVVSRATGLPKDRLSHERGLGQDLGLSSLERVELLASLEEHYGVGLDETEFAELTTLGEIDKHIESRRSKQTAAVDGPDGRQTAGRVAPPRWARSPLVRALGRLILFVLVRPVLRYFVRVRTEGAEHLITQSPPLIFAATHTSHLDVPVIVRGLPVRWRHRVAPAMRQEYFFPADGRGTRSGWLLRLEYVLTCMVFNAYPLPQRMGQFRESLRYSGELVGAGYCPLVFPEGRRTEDGGIGKFRPGIGFMAARLGLPVVPLRLEGTFDVYPIGSRWPGKGTVVVHVGEAMRPDRGEGYDEFAARLEAAVRRME